jgi:hypothetical protein
VGCVPKSRDNCEQLSYKMGTRPEAEPVAPLSETV